MFAQPGNWPRLYLLNCTSLAKDCAIELLTMDVNDYGIDVVLITETWFKPDDRDYDFAISDFQLFRRDRYDRTGGGVAMYVRSSLSVEEVLDPPEGIDPRLEMLWLKINTGLDSMFIGVLYHPPNPVYTARDLKTALRRTIDEISIKSEGALIVLGGDFNRLSDASVSKLGLRAEFIGPTHRGNALDRFYSNRSTPVYRECVAIESALRTEHLAVVASVDHVEVHAYRHTSTSVQLVPSTLDDCSTIFREPQIGSRWFFGGF